MRHGGIHGGHGWLNLVLGILLWVMTISSALAIVDGEVDPNAMDSAWAGVGSISVGGGTYSGALIATNYVLTAAHVVSGRAPEDITFNLNFGGDLTHRIAVEAVFIRPGYRGAEGFRHGGEYDIAVLKLAEPVPAGVPIYGLYDEELPQGAVLTFVGYGGGGIGTVGVTESPNPSVKRSGANVAECFAFTMGEENCGVEAFMGIGPKAIYVYRFDSPLAHRSNGSGRLLTGEAGLAGGDSGSPAFVYVQDGWRIAAVNTFAGRESAKGRMSVYGTVGGGV
ncbi:MAG: trypsin-like serine protease, partial [Burkholderiales bacterium]